MPQMMRMPPTMGHKFSEVPKAEIQRSQFDRSFGYKTTFDAGYLIPFYVDEALPGDTFQLNTQGFARLATPLKPLMDNMRLETFFFAIPYRLVWANFQKFMGEQDNPDDPTDYLVPNMSAVGAPTFGVGSIFDYMGLPVGVAGVGTTWSPNVLHLRAYNLVWNEFFRDQNIQDSVLVSKDDGPDDAADFTLLRRGKRHDYFTSCLPWPQKGDAVNLPLSGTAPVATQSPNDGSALTIIGAGIDGAARGMGTAAALLAIGAPSTSNPLYADLTAASGATINELRQAFQLQKLLERDARGGTRYTEKIKAHFGVTSPDARLQRPEYLGGGSTSVIVSPIAQTSASETSTPQGNLAAIGTSSFGGHGFVKSFTEHTLLLGLLSVRADLTYFQGMNRMWTRQTQYDYFWPALAHIGEQAVLQQEIYTANDASANGTIFGYQERYGEYRYRPGQLTGLMRPGVAGTLEIWHLAQEFGGGQAWDPTAPPTLSPDFIVENPPVDRVIAVPSEPHFIFDSYTALKCARPMPLFGVPGLIDHF